jgi:hypothetical protein
MCIGSDYILNLVIYILGFYSDIDRQGLESRA